MIPAAGCAAAEQAGPTNVHETATWSAPARLTSHYIATALEAVMSAAETNATLKDIADTSIISEFWVNAETGRVVFATDLKSGTRAAPFVGLLLGNKQAVTPVSQLRKADGNLFQ